MELTGLVGSAAKRATAAEVPEGKSALRLYFHDGAAYRTEELPFRRFVVLSFPEQLTEPAHLSELAGALPLRFLAEFDTAEEYDAALAVVRASKRPALVVRDVLRQALIRCRVRLFS